jgi:putative colanic acid biosynthesis acetyltransferase WcaB
VSLWARAKRCLIDNPRGSLMIGLYRVAHQASAKKHGLFGLNLIWAVPVLLGYKYLTEFVLGYEIPAATKIGRDFRIHHGYGIVINKHAVLGKNIDIRHGVTVGCKMLIDGTQGPSPVIEDDVELGANSVIIGGITIGHGAKIGAAAVVTRDVPPRAVMIGNPARQIR